MKNKLRKTYQYWITKQLDGIGVIEVILILVIIIGLVLIFRNQITAIIQSAFESINGNAGEINTEIKLE
ncbi:MAG: putative Flagellin, Flp1-like, domain [Herbinix sp.]|jgi:hypothetical protein|nr:putative Flagellin, Flp1-like, domain [Herbinix sp.]